MKSRYLSGVIAGTVMLATSLGFASSAVASGDAEYCRTISATLSASFYEEGCTSAVGFCTAGDLFRAPGGQLVGSTDYVASGIGGGVVGDESIVTPPVEPGTTWSYAGTLTLSTAFGDLVSSDVGVFDTAEGVFTEFNRVESGTGIFAGATGIFYINGLSFADGSGFDAEITGEVCVTSPMAAGQLRRVFGR